MYAIGYCQNCFAGASRIVGPFPTKEAALTAFNTANAEVNSKPNPSGKAWYWGEFSEFPRLEGCEVLTPEQWLEKK